MTARSHPFKYAKFLFPGSDGIQRVKVTAGNLQEVIFLLPGSRQNGDILASHPCTFIPFCSMDPKKVRPGLKINTNATFTRHTFINCVLPVVRYLVCVNNVTGTA